MRTGIFTLFCVTLGAALLEMLLPGGEGRGAKRGVRLMISLIVLLLLVQPLQSVLKADFQGGVLSSIVPDQDMGAAYEEIFKTAVEVGCEKDLKNGIHAWLVDVYGIEVRDVEIHIEFQEDGSLKRIAMKLSGKGILQDPHELEKAITEKFNCESEVR